MSLIWADGMCYGLTQEGEMRLTRPGRDQVEIVSGFEADSENRELAVAYPVVWGGRLCVCHGTHLWLYDVRAAHKNAVGITSAG